MIDSQLAALDRERKLIDLRHLTDVARIEGAEHLCRCWLAQIAAAEAETAKQGQQKAETNGVCACN